MKKKFRLNRSLKSNIKDTSFLLTAGVAITWAMSLGITSTTEFLIHPLQMLFQIFLVILTLRFIFINKYTMLFALSIFVTAIAIVFIDFLTTTNYYNYYYYYNYSIVSQINAFTMELMLYLNGLIPHSPAFETTLVWSLTIALSLFVFMFSYLWFNFFVLFIGGFLLFALVLTSGFFNSNIAFYTFIFSSIIYLIKYLNRDRKSSRAAYLLYTIPIAIFSFVSAFFIPVPEAGAADQVADTLIARPFNAINIILHDMFRPKYFTLAQTGFGTGDNRRLGGDVVTNYNVVMRVRSTEQTLYLAGNILDTYTGYSWLNQFTEQYELYFGGLNLERLEQQTSLFNIWSVRELTGQNNILDFSKEFAIFEYEEMHHYMTINEVVNLPFDEKQLIVDTLDNSSFAVFNTGILTGFNPGIVDNVFLINENGTITSQNLLSRNTTYYTNYVVLNSSVNTQAILQNSHADILTQTLETMSYDLTFLMPDGSTLTYQEILTTYLIPRAAWIREVYTQLPEHLPQRVIELAHYVTSEAKNDYEKARKLETFLRTFYYTLTPGHFPPNRDFVDYFLFDLQKGYCTFYASAFAVMARALGLPTRYVEGFIAVGTGSMDNYIYIRNRQGHAWVDVYFEGFGWYRFDPTPPSDTFGTIFTSNIATDFSFDWESLDLFSEFLWFEDYMFMSTEAFNEISSIDHDLYFEPIAIPDNIENNTIQNLILQSTLIVISIIIICILLRVIYVTKKSEKVKSMDNNIAVIKYFSDIVKYLEILGYRKKTSETTMQFTKEIDFVYEVNGEKYTTTDIAKIFSKAKYSNHSITNKERNIIESAKAYLDEQTKKDIGKPRYFTKKYILADF